jgi:predicted O-methyltransferase YrrM
MGNLSQKQQIILWYAKRPSLWRHALLFKVRKLGSKMDSAAARAEATEWAAQRAVPARDALEAMGLLRSDDPFPEISPAELEQAKQRAEASAVKMGGGGDIGLIHAAVLLGRASRVVETGVAYGWSSLAILSAQEKLGGGKLISVDMPYPGMRNEAWVGVAVPERLKDKWTLIRKPDRNGLKQAIRLFGNEIDLAHYDSDKSYWGRRFGYRLMWDALVSGGIFVSDDIQDNPAFKDFISEKGVPFSVTEWDRKYVGLAVKP